MVLAVLGKQFVFIGPMGMLTLTLELVVHQGMQSGGFHGILPNAPSQLDSGRQ